MFADLIGEILDQNRVKLTSFFFIINVFCLVVGFFFFFLIKGGELILGALVYSNQLTLCLLGDMVVSLWKSKLIKHA